MDDYFTVFGLPRKLALDEGELQRRFYDLSRRCHPDFHQGGTAAEQAAALGASARVNRAYRALREPLSRVEYLIALEDGSDASEGARDTPVAPPELLAEMMDVQEALEEARAAGLDANGRAALDAQRQQLCARYNAEYEAIVSRMADWDAVEEGAATRRALLAWFRQRLATRAYLGTVIGDLREALGEDDDRHGAHRRH